MGFEEFILDNLTFITDDTFIFTVKPTKTNEIFPFIPGQFCQIKNPSYERPEDAHSFSIASSPNTSGYLEFCIKIYGPWTKAISQKQKGDRLLLMGPLGRFTWDNTLTNAVFLAGGVGITPMISMLRYMQEEKQNPHLVVLYGNRNEASIAYREAIDQIIARIGDAKVLHVLSDLKPEDIWHGYKGFITQEILESEVDMKGNPTFFICGPPIFVDLMKKVLKELAIPEAQIKHELFSSPPPPKTV